MSFKQRIKDGIEGKYSGLNNGLKRINDYIFGVQRGCYSLIGGLSGAAKTTFVDFQLLNAIEDAISKNIDINIFYYSLEIDEISKKSNWLSNIIYKKYGIIVTPEKIKGLGDFRLSKEELELVNDCLPDLELIWSKITWIWEATNPTGIYKSIFSFMSERGTFNKEPYIDEFGNKKERIVKYINNNPESYNILVLDHLALMRLEGRDGKTFSLKENIDKMSEYCVILRNIFGLTIYLVQQFNQGLSNIDRVKYTGIDISPSQSDFKDSTNPYADCDIAIGILNAHKMNLDSYIGYNIKDYKNPNQGFLLKDLFRAVKIIKNRLSRDNISIGLLFLPEAGTFEELPKPNEVENNPDFNNKILNLIKKNK